MGPTNNNKKFAKPASISIPTEPIGSIARPLDLIDRVAKGDSEDPNLVPLYEDAIRDTIERFEATGSPNYGPGVTIEFGLLLKSHALHEACRPETTWNDCDAFES